MTKELEEVREALEKIAAKEHMSYSQASELPFSFDIAKEAITKLDAVISNANSGEGSDGYHTFNELYEHRHSLFALLWKEYDGWKSKKHSDGTMFEGWFIAGIDLPAGDVTYHIPMRLWELFDSNEIAQAPTWDGHTSDDVIERLQSYGRINTIKGSSDD